MNLPLSKGGAKLKGQSFLIRRKSDLGEEGLYLILLHSAMSLQSYSKFYNDNTSSQLLTAPVLVRKEESI
jgi:hypothetical protein